jgi:vacuolar-type H+-ATPase subunit E/Vma4
MTVRIDESLGEALAPARAALLAAARRAADQRLAEARAQAAATTAAAATRVDEIISAARKAGVADAEAVLATEKSRARRAARGRTLRARLDAYEDLRRECRHAIVRIRDEPGYAAIRDSLAAVAQRLLGPDAEIVEADDGGVIGRSGARRVDLSLTAFADRAADSVAAGMDQP